MCGLFPNKVNPLLGKGICNFFGTASLLLFACKYEQKVEEIPWTGPLPDVQPGEEHREDGGGRGDHVDVGQGEVPQSVELADDAQAARDGAGEKLQSHS